MSWRRWNWLDDLALPLAFAALRAICVWPWLELLRSWLAPSRPAPFLPLWLMIGLCLAALAATRLALGRLGPRQAQGAIAVAGLATILLALWWQSFRPAYPVWDPHWLAALGRALTHWGAELPAPFVALVAGGCLWLRGILDGRRRPSRDHAWKAFSAGLAAFAVAVLVAAATGHSALAGTLGLVLAYFAAGLAALAVTGLQLTRGPDQALGGARLSATGYWLGSVAALIAGLTICGLLLNALISPGAISQAFAWARGLWGLAVRALGLLGLAVSYVIFLVVEPVIRWLRTLYAGQMAKNAPLPELPQVGIPEPGTYGGLRIPNAPIEYRWLGLAALVLGAGLIFALAVRRRRRQERPGGDESRDTVLTAGLLQEQVAAIVRMWAGRLRRTAGPVLRPFLSFSGESATRRTIRAVYQALLRDAGARGRPRRRGQTPTEYGRALGEAWPEARSALTEITAAYLVARYAPEPPTQGQAARVREEWRRLRALLRERTAPQAK